MIFFYQKVVIGMEIFDNVYSGYGQDPDQDLIYSQGNPYLTANFPKLTYIQSVRFGVPSTPDDHGGLTTTGEVFLIILACLCAIIGIALIGFYFYRRHQQKQSVEYIDE